MNTTILKAYSTSSLCRVGPLAIEACNYILPFFNFTITYLFSIKLDYYLTPSFI
jgi:hypothetical protein